MKECAFAKVVDANMLLACFCVQPNTHNIMVVRGENNLPELLDRKLKSPDDQSKRKSSCNDK